MRATDGSGEVAVPAYELFSSTAILGRMAMDRMLAGGVHPPVPVRARTGRGAHRAGRDEHLAKSAVSRRFAAQTETALAELPAADLSELDLVAMMVDGVHFGEHTCVVALGDRSSTELGTSSINWSERVYCMQVLTTSKNPPRSCPFGERRRAIRAMRG
jgi:hypothetical protein